MRNGRNDTLSFPRQNKSEINHFRGRNIDGRIVLGLQVILIKHVGSVGDVNCTELAYAQSHW
jgi:hypothetical protein